jgi:hypothetical protein
VENPSQYLADNMELSQITLTEKPRKIWGHRCEHCPETVQRAAGTPKAERSEGEK